MNDTKTAFATLDQTTQQRLIDYEKLLLEWNQKINLIGPATVNDIRQRHTNEGLSLLPFLPTNTSIKLADMGSGGGVPGIIIGLATDHPITLIEANGKKAMFLQYVVATLEAKNITICQQRLEETTVPNVDIITARACAPLDKLLGYVHYISGEISREILPESAPQCLFLKGENWQSEIAVAKKHWTFHYQAHSISEIGSQVLQIEQIQQL